MHVAHTLAGKEHWRARRRDRTVHLPRRKHMAAITEAQREERIAAVVARADPRESTGEVPLDTFSREYYRQVDLEDLDERTPEDLLGALLSHWQFASQRTPGVAKVRVFSPTPGADGWGSR